MGSKKKTTVVEADPGIAEDQFTTLTQGQEGISGQVTDLGTNLDTRADTIDQTLDTGFGDMGDRFDTVDTGITGLSDDVRISKRLNVPSSRLRGSQRGKVGPVENNDYIGGNHVTSLNFSATLPTIVQGLDNLDVGIFLDAANIWGVDYDSSLDDKSTLRSSTGVALNLMTPIGPLSFSFANALSKASTDKTETFRFNLGTQF